MYKIEQGERPQTNYQISTEYKNFTITAIFKGDKAAKWDAGLPNYNNYKVTVKNTETGQKTSFDFWASIARPKLGKDDLLHCFYCLVSDGIAGDQSFEDFCTDLGYDTDSRSARKTWKACGKQAEKLGKIYDGDVYDLCNELNEIAG